MTWHEKELRERYPEWEMKRTDYVCTRDYPDGRKKGDEIEAIQIWTDTKGKRGQSTHYTLPITDPNHIERLDLDYAVFLRKVEVMEKFPNLYPWVTKSLDVTGLWVCHDGRDGAALGSFPNPLTDEELAHWNELAGQSLQEGMFWCSGHNRPEPQADYDYFFFAGNYCKEWGEANPGHKKDALSETYN